MSDKNKVVAIEEILKTIGNKDNDCSNVIYIGDGLTDYYAMKYIKEHGGTTIFVYQDPNHKDILAIKEKKDCWLLYKCYLFTKWWVISLCEKIM